MEEFLKEFEVTLYTLIRKLRRIENALWAYKRGIINFDNFENIFWKNMSGNGENYVNLIACMIKVSDEVKKVGRTGSGKED